MLIINRYSKKHLELFLTTVLIEGHEAFHKQGMMVPPGVEGFFCFDVECFFTRDVLIVAKEVTITGLS